QVNASWLKYIAQRLGPGPVRPTNKDVNFIKF
ncbi:unnamed protein product, partial [marine sediment metagenome]